VHSVGPLDPDGNVLAAPALSSVIFERLGRDEDLSDSPYLLVAGILDPALTEVSYLGAGDDTTCRLIDLLAALPAPLRMTIHLQEGLELLRYVHTIYDTKGHAV
jgi:hypothetical protein